MSVCRVCGGHTSTSRYNNASGSYEPICDDCEAERTDLLEDYMEGEVK